MQKSNTRSCRFLCLNENRIRAEGFERIAGVDEAGRGPLAGPVVAAAVILSRNSYPRGIRDSKQLSPKQREDLFYRICEKAEAVGIGIISEKVIDRVNILKATHLAMRRAVSSLELKPDFVLIDGIVAPKTGFPQKAIVDGDARSITIAAASIIAKVARDRIMVEQDGIYPQYGFAQHKGYGTRSHLENLAKYGPCLIHRLSFRPVAEAAGRRSVHA